MRYTKLPYVASFATSLAMAAPLAAEVPKVVTDFTPVTALVSLVMGDLGAPVQLLDKGADPHDFALRPSQMSEVTGADLVVWIGPELTPALEGAVAATSGAQLALLRAVGTETQEYGAKGEHDHGHAEEDGHAEDDGHGTHTHEGTDPHAWTDPHNAVHWLGVIAGELSRIDPDNAAAYAANAANATVGLEKMENEIAGQLAPVKDRPFVTFHDAFGYFTGHFGLANAGALSLGDASAPGAARVSELRERIIHDKIACVFPEAGHDPALLAQIIDGTGARLGEPLDPEGLGFDPGPGAYEALMRGMAGSLAACLAD
jgi:zinc transport system substrate-binding protein